MAQAGRPLRHSRQSSRITIPSGNGRNGRSRGTSPHSAVDEETAALIRRVLCQPAAGEGGDPLGGKDADGGSKVFEDLPSLTTHQDLDFELYALLAIILSTVVQSWYNRITPDQDFVKEIVHIIAHCTHGLQERLTNIDNEELLLDELPALLDAHVCAMQTALGSARLTINAGALKGRLEAIYHALRPHFALSPLPVDETSTFAQTQNEIDWSQALVHAILPLLLPPEDLSNPCLEVLVSEVFSELILRVSVLGKTSEPWLIWDGITKAIHALKLSTIAPNPSSTSPASRLEQFGLLSQAEADDAQAAKDSRNGAFDTILSTFWLLLQGLILAWGSLRTVAMALTRASSLPPRHTGTKSVAASSSKLRDTQPRPAAHPRATHLNPELHQDRKSGQPEAHPPSSASQQRPIVAMRLWNALGRLVELQERMPWLHGCLSLLQWTSVQTKVCGTNSAVDRLLSATFHDHLLDPAILPRLVRNVRLAAFPNNAFPPARVPPTGEQIAEIKRECAETIIGSIPDIVRRYYFATTNKAAVVKDVERMLDVVGDAYINKHLIVAAIELLVVRLFPELAKAENT